MHSASAMVVIVFLVFRSGDLGWLSRSLGTLTGMAIYAWLWVWTFGTTRRALEGALSRGRLALPEQLMLVRAALWGGANGTAFFLGVLAISGTRAITPGGLGDGPDLYTVTELALAGVAACAVGVIAGLMFTVVDGVVLFVAGYVVAWCLHTRGNAPAAQS